MLLSEHIGGAASAGLDCKKGFPSAFGKLPSLETLTLRFNNFNGDTLDNVAAVSQHSQLYVGCKWLMTCGLLSVVLLRCVSDTLNSDAETAE